MVVTRFVIVIVFCFVISYNTNALHFVCDTRLIRLCHTIKQKYKATNLIFQFKIKAILGEKNLYRKFLTIY